MTLGDIILFEAARMARNTDEAAQPPEVVELTEAEVRQIMAEYRAAAPTLAADTPSSTTYLGLAIRVVETPGPCRVRSRAEVMLERLSPPRGTPLYVMVSTPR